MRLVDMPTLEFETNKKRVMIDEHSIVAEMQQSVIHHALLIQPGSDAGSPTMACIMDVIRSLLHRSNTETRCVVFLHRPVAITLVELRTSQPTNTC